LRGIFYDELIKSDFRMSKFLFAILLLIFGFAVMAQGVLVYQLSATQVVISGEESPEETPQPKEGKEITHDKTFYSFDFHQYAFAKKVSNPLVKTLVNSKGFFDKPYNPPETI
jgi:hypothetical protein